MPLDYQMQAVIDLVGKSKNPEFWQLTPDQAREEYLKRSLKLAVNENIFRSEDKVIFVRDRKLKLRIYWPRELLFKEKLPILVFYHGGGYVIGSLDTHDAVCRLLANRADVIVVSVDYRLAPESKFPAAVDDSFFALNWVADNANTIGGDATRIAVGGDSAGANLATVATILARDAGLPKISLQILIYPVTAPEPETKSHYKFAEGYLLTRKLIGWFYKHYLRSSRDTQDFRYAPLVADDLSKLPPTLMIVAGHDPLLDEGIAYARRLIESGNEVRLSHYPGMAHGFFLMGGAIDAADDVMSECVLMVKKIFKNGNELKVKVI